MKAVTERIKRMLTLSHEKASTSFTSSSQNANFVEKKKKTDIYRKNNFLLCYLDGIQNGCVVVANFNYMRKLQNEGKQLTSTEPCIR